MYTDAPSAAAVSVKLPEFWPNEAELWFVRAEAQLSTRGIKAFLTKYYHVGLTIEVNFLRKFLLYQIATNCTLYRNEKSFY